MLLLAIASITDLRRRQVPTWITLGGSGAGLLVAAASGWEALQVSLLGLVAGGLLLPPFVLAGGFTAYPITRQLVVDFKSTHCDGGDQ